MGIAWVLTDSGVQESGRQVPGNAIDGSIRRNPTGFDRHLDVYLW